jgi:DNA repair photolyase
MFAKVVPSEWIVRVLDYCDKFENSYLFQSKNPARFLEFVDHPIFQSKKAVLATTIETNRWYKDIMNKAPQPYERANAMAAVAAWGVPTMVTVEPAMAFDHDELVEMILACNPIQVNIGRNTSEIQLPEPTRAEVQALIADLSNFTKVNVKSNASAWQ